MPKQMKFHIWKAASRQWYFHLRGANGEIIVPSEGYKNKKDMLAAIVLLKNSKDAPVVEDKKL